ncbi:MAG: hypothetical protein HFI09_03165 [Bacilli bacterium]|nr:hypothetical protein [Bacilli bacterium]
MERKNTILLTVIAIATLLVAVVGATFAYFTATITDNRNTDPDSGKTNITAGQVANTTVVANVAGAAGKFTAENVYPGHKEVAALQVTANGAAGSKTVVDFTYDVTTNDLGANNVKVSLYKSTTLIPTTTNYFECTPSVETVGDDTHYSETCQTKSVGTLVKETTLTGGSQKVTIGQDSITTTAANTDETVYYYVVVEFVNQNADQNAVMGKTLEGTVSVVPAA